MTRKKPYQYYKLKKDSCDKYFDMYVFKNQKEMLKYFKANDIEAEPDCGGLVQPHFHIVRDDGEKYICCKWATVFLYEGNLGAGVVSHEALHLAMTHERTIVGFNMQYGDDCTEVEERLAYTLTEVVQSIYSVLFANKHC